MSTKTSIKRIALVAATALTLGGFSVITASTANAGTYAAVPFYVTKADSTSYSTAATAAAAMTATAVAGPYNYIELTGNDTLSAGTLGITAAGSGTSLSVTSQPTQAANLGDTLTVSSTGLQITTSHASPYLNGSKVKVMTPTAGTVTVTITKNVDNNGIVTTTTLQTLTITVNAASVVGAYSAGNSFAVRQDTTTVSPRALAALDTPTVTAATTDSTATISKGTAGTATAASVIAVRLLDTQASPAGIAGVLVNASVSGPGLVKGTGSAQSDTDTTFAGSFTTVGTSMTDALGWAFFNVASSGASGVGTVTITYNDGTTTYTVATKSFTFYGAVASLKATQGKYIVSNAGAATGGKTYTTYAVQLTGADASGNAVDITGLTIDATSDNALAIATGQVSVGGAQCAADALNTMALDCTVTGVTGATAGTKVNVTYSYTDSSLVKYSASPIAYTIGGTAITSVALTFDKATYAVGDLVTATLTAKDSKGNLVADKQYTVFDTTSSTTVFATSAQITSTPFGSAYVTFLKGVATATFYAPYTTSTFNMKGTTNNAVLAPTADLATAGQGVDVTGSFAITGAGGVGGDAALALDAANAATDAANNAYDEAQNATQAAQDALAAVTALAKQVSSLIASVKSLTALVSKIKAKVGA